MSRPEFSVVHNDRKVDNMVQLLHLRVLFSKALVKMPRDYVVRMIFDRRHYTYTMYREDGSIVGGVYDWMFGDYIQKRNVILTDLPGQYPNMEVTVTVNSTTGSAIGVFAIGRVMTIGVTEYGAGAGIINFGKVADDGFGNRTWIEGQWANRVTLPLIANTSDLNRIHRQLAGVRSTPCIYIGSELDSMEPLVCYGVYRDLYITVPNFPTIALNLEIDGMNNQ